MFPRPYILPVVALLTAVAYAFVGAALLSGAFFGMALGLALWALGAQRAVAPFQWFGAGIAAFAALVIARIVFFS